MSFYPLVRALQNFPITGWWWVFWISKTTGQIVLIPWHEHPGPSFRRFRKS